MRLCAACLIPYITMFQNVVVVSPCSRFRASRLPRPTLDLHSVYPFLPPCRSTLSLSFIFLSVCLCLSLLPAHSPTDVHTLTCRTQWSCNNCHSGWWRTVSWGWLRSEATRTPPHWSRYRRWHCSLPHRLEHGWRRSPEEVHVKRISKMLWDKL